MMKIHDRVCRLATPIGDLDVYYQRRPFIITEIILPQWDKDAGPIASALVYVKTPPGQARPVPACLAGLGETMGLLTDYFNGVAIKPPWHLLSMDGLSVLAQQVLRAVADIPFGTLKAYGDIAEAVGRRGACRFVGNIMAKNPFPIFIPCHRVVRKNGAIGGFGGGPDLKKRLIDFEIETSIRIKQPCRL